MAKDDLLAKLKENRETHTKCFEEARLAYVEKAQEAIEKKLEELKEGKATHLAFSLRPPHDHSAEYDVVIQMVEATVDETIELTAEQFSCFILDEWQWSRSWFMANSGLTGPTGPTGCAGSTGPSGQRHMSTVYEIASQRGYLEEEDEEY